eukprot:TRINITY_DN72090_c0_g1_i1.p1 TRINITY_DN72090_c0_g1~~TRINITY_DN72090_c0_g1_i1.p1  ORF type:complete len:388 (+),score=30.57 TRINITY_DN72090_c0_g1_i1:121-1164(+)
MLNKGNKVEKTRLRSHANEKCYGFQIATKVIDEGVSAAHLAQQAGARWIDLNCGCPIHEATRRGMGAVLLRKPRKLARLVNGLVQGSPLPVTVKIRTGENHKKINAEEIVEGLYRAGAAAVSIHGRTMEQRYKKPADWQLISQVASQVPLPIIGNEDILTHYEAYDRINNYNCTAIMAGRGALIKPWIFEEFKHNKEIHLDAKQRIGVYRQLVAYMKEHFGNDERGKKKSWYFFPWHFSFFCRYRQLPEDIYGNAETPLMQRREDLFDTQIGESLDNLQFLERLLRCQSVQAHEHIANIIWESTSDFNAINSLEQIGTWQLICWEEDFKNDNNSRQSGTQSMKQAYG